MTQSLSENTGSIRTYEIYWKNSGHLYASFVNEVTALKELEWAGEAMAKRLILFTRKNGRKK